MNIETSFLDHFAALSQIGATPNSGVERQAATQADSETRQFFEKIATEAGFEVFTDAIGNQFAKIEWIKDQPSILIGSHMDSQPLGGRFDGAYGVLAALHVAKTINQAVQSQTFTPQYNLVVVNWFNEEGARFAPSIMGSSAFAGIYALDAMLAVKDHAGITVREALEAINQRENKHPGPIMNYAEIHIEQGRILEREGIDIGLVNESWYTQKINIDVIGEQSHTGATAMADRHDALITAAKIVLLVQKVTGRFPAESLVSSVGKFHVYPNSPIVVARKVELVADLRSNDPKIVQEARNFIFEEIRKLELSDNIQIMAKDFDIRPKYYLSPEGIERNRKLATELNLSCRNIATMAGHDAVAMNAVIPTLMLFIPSINGVSHCEKELSSDADMLKGLKLFTQTVKSLLLQPLPNDQPYISQAIE